MALPFLTHRLINSHCEGEPTKSEGVDVFIKKNPKVERLEIMEGQQRRNRLFCF